MKITTTYTFRPAKRGDLVVVKPPILVQSDGTARKVRGYAIAEALRVDRYGVVQRIRVLTGPLCGQEIARDVAAELIGGERSWEYVWVVPPEIIDTAAAKRNLTAESHGSPRSLEAAKDLLRPYIRLNQSSNRNSRAPIPPSPARRHPGSGRR